MQDARLQEGLCLVYGLKIGLQGDASFTRHSMKRFSNMIGWWVF